MGLFGFGKKEAPLEKALNLYHKGKLSDAAIVLALHINKTKTSDQELDYWLGRICLEEYAAEENKKRWQQAPIFLERSAAAGDQRALQLLALIEEAKEQGMAEEGDCALIAALLGLSYENGMGVEQDMDAALRWLRLAAEQENPIGMAQLACL